MAQTDDFSFKVYRTVDGSDEPLRDKIVDNAEINVPAGVDLDGASMDGIFEIICLLSPEILVAAGVSPKFVEGYANEDKVDEEGREEGRQE